MLRVAADVPAQLPQFDLTGRARPFDESVLFELHRTLGSSKLTALLQLATTLGPVGLTGFEKPELVLAGVYNCLPVGLRRSLSFSTRLKYSPRRPFQWTILPSDKSLLRQIVRQHQLHVVDFAQEVPPAPSSEWPLAVVQAAETKMTMPLAAAIGESQAEIGENSLNALGAKLLTACASR